MALEDSVQQLNNFSMPGLTSVQVSAGNNTNPYLEAASQTWKAGAPLVASSGKLIQASEDITTAICVGFATVDASGTTNNLTPVVPCLPGLEFEATLEDGGSGDHAIAQTDLFVKRGLAVTSGGLWYVDSAESSNVAVVIVELVDPIGTVQGRVRARILNKVCLANT